MANLMKAWAKADADGSGTLDKEELKVVLESMNRNQLYSYASYYLLD